MSRERASPRLLVEWSGRGQDFREALVALCAALPALPLPPARRGLRADLVGRHWPKRALAVSVALHVLFAFVPLPEFLTRAPAAPAGLRAVRIEYDLRWTGGTKLLPPIAPKRSPKRPASLAAKKEEPRPRRGAEAMQAQIIISDPPEPNHPRQTLLTQFGLEKARVEARDLQLPNMVIPPSPQAAPAPEVDLRRLRAPAILNVPGAAATPQPPRPTIAGELALAEARVENLNPRLAVEPGGAVPAPEFGAAASAPGGGDQVAPGIIALSAQPAPPKPVLALPEANLRARFAVGPVEGSGSPGGVPGGAPEVGGPGGAGGEGGRAGSLAVPGIYVSNAGPAPPRPVVAGPPGSEAGGTGVSPAAESSISTPRDTRPDPRSTQSDDKPIQRRAEEMIEGLPPGSHPRGGRRLYTLLINMPNLSSQTGSWVLRFAELGEASATAAGGAANGFALEAPVAVKKVDPRYPAQARRDRLEGVVFLYGVIRADGTVESVRVVRSVHALLDQNAVSAFERWRFEPGRKNGLPVALEVVVEIPFRLDRLF